MDGTIHLLNWDQGLLLGRDKKIGQQLIGVSPVMIPQIIAGHIFTPVPFPFQMYWRCETQLNINQLLVLLLNKLHSMVDSAACWMRENKIQHFKKNNIVVRQVATFWKKSWTLLHSHSTRRITHFNFLHCMIHFATFCWSTDVELCVTGLYFDENNVRNWDFILENSVLYSNMILGREEGLAEEKCSL